MERHPLRISYLIAGVVFVAVAIVGLADIRVIRLTELAWAGPGLLVVLGIVLVVGTATRRGDRASDDLPDAPDETSVDDDVDEQATAPRARR